MNEIQKLESETFSLYGYANHLLHVIINFLPTLAMSILTLVIGLWFIKKLVLLVGLSLSKREVEVSLQTFLKSLISIGLKVILFISVAGMLGIQTSSFVAILGAASLAVGLALQGSLSNFAGGVLILFFKPFKVGDSIEAQGQGGEVKEIQIFNTILLTGDNKTIIIPNGILSNGTIINNTRHGISRADIIISIPYSFDIEKAKQLVMQEISKNELVLTEPLPTIVINDLTETSIKLTIRPYTLSANKGIVQAQLTEAILHALIKEGVKLPIIR